MKTKFYLRMRYTLQIDIDKDKISFAEEFFKSITFIKNVKILDNNEITSEAILKSIEDFETNKSVPTLIKLAELKSMIDV
ncbi:MAG TPA: hypothetical protein PKD85_01480 [Saprospiraceae bacterium]|nr:hypothetical protein [Saprospiraceae bacterium]